MVGPDWRELKAVLEHLSQSSEDELMESNEMERILRAQGALRFIRAFTTYVETIAKEAVEEEKDPKEG